MTNTTISTSLDALAVGRTSSNPFVDQFSTRNPGPNDVNYPIQKKWLNTSTGQLFELESFVSSNGLVTANWILIGATSMALTLTGNTGGAVPATANNINVVGDGTFISVAGNPATSTLTISPAGGITTLYTENTGTATPMAGNLNVVGGTGVSTVGSGNTITINAAGAVPLTFTANTGTATPSANNLNILGGTGISTTGSGSTITINATDFATNYTNVNHAASPYTVLLTDEYISVDCSAGVVTLDFPNAPTANRTWVIKDRTGSASTNNITLTTPGGTVTFDGLTSYVMNSNYQAINLLANATPTYEVY